MLELTRGTKEPTATEEMVAQMRRLSLRVVGNVDLPEGVATIVVPPSIWGEISSRVETTEDASTLGALAIRVSPYLAHNAVGFLDRTGQFLCAWIFTHEQVDA